MGDDTPYSNFVLVFIMGEANRRKKLDPNFGKISGPGKKLIYSTEELPDKLANSVKNILKKHPEINKNNWNFVYQDLSSLVVSHFLELSKFFTNKKQLLNVLANHYHQKYSKTTSRLADYPYYLISLFYENINKLVFDGYEELESKLDCPTHFNFLDEIIEQLLVLMPRDIVKGVFLYVSSESDFIKVYIDKSKENTKSMFNHEAHFNRYLSVASFSGYNIWSRPLYSLSPAGSPFIRCQGLTNYGGAHRLMKTIAIRNDL